MEVKQALRDHRFRDSLPITLKEDVAKYLQNPGCPCNLPIYKKILAEAGKNLIEYYPGRTISAEEVILIENQYLVINCGINELDSKLKNLGNGRKQIAMARYEDQVTVIVNELDY